MEYRTVSAKLPADELTMFKAHCEKKGVTPANLIRDLILTEMKITVPHTLAGQNRIFFDKRVDSFMWSIKLDSGKEIEVLRNISPNFFESLFATIKSGLDERASFIQKKTVDSIPIPTKLLRMSSK